MASGTHYNQPQISVEEQITTLKNDGLVFIDEDRADHLLGTGKDRGFYPDSIIIHPNLTFRHFLVH